VQARRGSAGRAWATTLASVVLALAAASSAGAQGAIYSFVDANGVAHFTNAPRDSRYVRLAWSAESVRPDERTAPSRWEYDGLIGLSARQHRVPPALVKAVIAAESCFDPSAVSRKGAQGLMQLMPETARSLGVSDPLRPEQNVDGGVRYLRDMMDRYGTLSLALAAYNAGPEAVDRHGGVPPYRETRDYVKRVLTYYRAYDGDFRR
jgi:soluble lytic murein transglycosylase-like protein